MELQMLRFSQGASNGSLAHTEQFMIGRKLVPLHSPILTLHASKLDSAFVLALCTSIGSIGKVTTLELGDNNLDDSVIQGIIDNVILNPKIHLKRLDLGGNKITNQGALLLKQAITNHPYLKALMLDGNPGISKSVLNDVAQTIKNNVCSVTRVSDQTQAYASKRRRGC
jgi:hypothetical protein